MGSTILNPGSTHAKLHWPPILVGQTRNPFLNSATPLFVCGNLRVSLHHEPWSQIIEDGLFPWSDLMLQHPWSEFLQKSVYKAFGPLIRCKPNVDQGEWPCTKSECAKKINICPKRANLRKVEFDHSFAFSCLHVLFPRKKSLNFDLNIISLSWALAFFSY